MGAVSDSLRATLTTRGDLPVQAASDVSRLPLGTAGQVLTSDGTDALWKPGHRISVVNSWNPTVVSPGTTATSILNAGAGTNAFAAASIGDYWDLEFGSSWKSPSASGTLTIRVAYGTTQPINVATASIAANANPRRVWGRLRIFPLSIGTLIGGSAFYSGIVTVSTATTGTIDALQASASTLWSGGQSIATANSTAANLDVTLQMTAAGTFEASYVNLTYFPKGV